MSVTRTGMRWSPTKRASMEVAIKRGSDSPVWKGDDITYSSMHSWLGRKFTKTGVCSVCGDSCKTQWANLSGEYRRNFSDFAEMCGPCHLRYDWSRKLGVEQLREALRYARDCIASPDRPFSDGEDIYDTAMMMKALRQADAALAIEESA